MDEETRDYLAAMEARLTLRLDTMQDAVIERLHSCEAAIGALADRAMNLLATMLRDIGKHD